MKYFSLFSRPIMLNLWLIRINWNYEFVLGKQYFNIFNNETNTYTKKHIPLLNKRDSRYIILKITSQVATIRSTFINKKTIIFVNSS